MIKKTTSAIFLNGCYKGTYDWEGGIPLSVGDIINVETETNQIVAYSLTGKTISLRDTGDTQHVHIEYSFDIAA